MPLMAWDAKLSVNVKHLDDQHHKLVDMVNGLHDAMSKGQGKDVLAKLFDELVKYTRTHFATEERYMQQINYPGLPEHKQQHEQLTQKALELKQRLDGGQISLTIETMNFLKSWLVDHILGSDRKYAPATANATP